MHQEPSSDAERVLRDACSFVLQVPPADIHLARSFITNGGDSISAMRVSPRCKAHGFLVPVATILASKSLADAAAAASPCGNTTASSSSTVAAQAGAAAAHEEAAESMTRSAALEPFCLLRLEKNKVEDLLQKIAPELRFPTSQVLDVAPTTHTQALCADAAMRSPPQGCFVFYMDIPPAVPVDAITDFAQTLWNTVDILRTVFVRHPGSPDRLLQVITAPGPVPLQIHAVQDQDCLLAAASAALFDEQLLQSPLELGAPYIQFMVVHHAAAAATSSPTRLAFRVSHAHYDGLSLPPLLDCLAASLQGRAWPESPSFLAYVAQVVDRSTPTLAYWKAALAGSRPLAALAPTGRPHRLLSSTRVVQQPPQVPGVTAATVFLAACAEALARLHDTRDVHFTLTVSGRTMFPDLAGVVGPCLNQVPLRVVLPRTPSLRTAVDSVRRAHLDMLPAEVATLQDIYKTCTDWPEEHRKMAYNVHFDDLAARSVDLLGDGVQTPLLTHGHRGVWEHSEEIWIIATPVDAAWQIALTVNASHCSAGYLEKVGDTLVDVLAAADV